MPALLRRPLPLALLIAALAETLFAWGVTTPNTLVFDEIHYVPAARTLLALEGPRNIEHPLLAKTLIAAGIAVFGDGPLGWRLLSTVAATAVVVGVFAILWLGLRRIRPAATGAAIVALNFTVFVQARIAMLDGPMAAFVVLGIAALLWAMRAAGARAWRRWTLGAALLGLATACKWAAAPYVAFAAVAFLLLRRNRPDRWAGMHAGAAVAVLGVVSVGTYLLTFWPAFLYTREPMTLGRLIPFQREMYARQVQVLPAHTYQSAWWSWPLDIRPIWYLYEPVDGAQRGILMIGNPAVMWGGLVAVAACLWWWRDRARGHGTAAGAAAGLWIGGFAIWAAIPKSLGFFYYYYLPSIWLGIALAVSFDRLRRRGRHWDEAYLAVAATLFLWFHPILSAAALPGAQGFRRWMWFPTWV